MKDTKTFGEVVDFIRRKGLLTGEETERLSGLTLRLSDAQKEAVLSASESYLEDSGRDVRSAAAELDADARTVLACRLFRTLWHHYNDAGRSETMYFSALNDFVDRLREHFARTGEIGGADFDWLAGWFDLSRIGLETLQFTAGKDAVTVTHRLGTPDERLCAADLRRAAKLFADLYEGETVPFVTREPLPGTDGKLRFSVPKKPVLCRILRDNPDLEALLTASRRPTCVGKESWRAAPKVLTLLHFSDPHASAVCVREIAALMKELGGKCEDAVCTGDLVRAYFGTGVRFWNETPGAERILFCLGNHDMLDNPYFDWTHLIPQELAYDTYFAPNFPHWGAESAGEKKTYYRKHYEAQKVTLIALNDLLEGEEDAAQCDFLRETLTQARERGFAVVIAIHDPPQYDREAIPCNFSTLPGKVSDPCGHGCTERYQTLVQEFIDAGGEFLCWLAGHTHKDFVCRNPKFPRQLFLIVGAAGALRGERSSDLTRVDGEKSEFLMNFVSFDTEGKQLRVIRAGADRTCELRSRRLLCIRYDTGEILTQE